MSALTSPLKLPSCPHMLHLSPPLLLGPPPTPSLPLNPPKFLLNPSRNGRCFRCFERGHFAARCREPRRCLFCMRFGHSARFCRLRSASLVPTIEPRPTTARPLSSAAFLPFRPQSTGQPSLSGCVALVDVVGQHLGDSLDFLPRGLVARFGGSPSDYRVAFFRDSSSAVFFPSWVARESAIGRSPIPLGDFVFHFSN